MTTAVLADKVAFVRAALTDLDALPRTSIDEFLSDRRNLPSALHWLQTAIQALLDIGLHITAERGLPTPRTSLEVLERLEDASLLPPGTAVRFRPIVGFRNRVVHLYDRVDPAIVFRIVEEERDDLRELLALLLDAAARTA